MATAKAEEAPPAAPPATAGVGIAPAPAPPAYGWKRQIAGQFSLAQSTFDNWSQGGDDALAWQASLLTQYNNDQADYNWANTAKLAFGQINSGDTGIRKSVDEIMLESVWSYKLKIEINPYVAAKGETQFTAGYDYKSDPPAQISNFMDPGYITESVGLGYAYQDWIKTRLGFAVRETVTRDYALLYADNPDTAEIEKIKTVPGLESVTDLNLKLTDILLFTSKLEIFSNLKAVDQAIVRWDNLFTASISKWINVGFNIQLLYDKSFSTRRQLKEALTTGITYTFSD